MRATKIMHDITVQKLWDKLERLEKSVEYFEENGISSGFKVYYQVDVSEVYTEEYKSGQVIILPTTFTPVKEGYTFLGWRKDNIASSTILTGDDEDSKMRTEDVMLYAVFQNETDIILSYDPNGGTTAPPSQVGHVIYNNGNSANPTFTLSASIGRSNYEFKSWALGGTGGSTYDAGGTITLSESTIMYATWYLTYYSGSTTVYYSRSDSYVDNTITFPAPFKTTPTITGITWDCCSARNVTTTGFTLRATNGDWTNAATFNTSVGWTAKV